MAFVILVRRFHSSVAAAVVWLHRWSTPLTPFASLWMDQTLNTEKSCVNLISAHIKPEVNSPKSSSTDWFVYCDGLLCMRFCELLVLKGMLLLLSYLFINLCFCKCAWSMKPPPFWLIRWWLSIKFAIFNWSVIGLEFIMNWFCCCCCWFLWKSKNFDMLGCTWFMSGLLWFILCCCCCCWEYCWLNIMRLSSFCANMLSTLSSKINFIIEQLSTGWCQIAYYWTYWTDSIPIHWALLNVFSALDTLTSPPAAAGPRNVCWCYCCSSSSIWMQIPSHRECSHLKKFIFMKPSAERGNQDIYHDCSLNRSSLNSSATASGLGPDSCYCC